jgi:signal transduction histidine kinase
VMGELLSSFPLGADEGISSRTLRTGQAQLLAVITPEQLRSLIKPEHWPYLDRFGIYSLMVAPLRVNGEVIGTLGALRDNPGQPYTESDLTLLQELADRAALAVVNARLYQQAQDAIKIRDQFLSIAAHELKTPLTALSAQAQLVQRRLSRGEQTPERLVRSVDTIVRQTERLDVMVHTLLDVGRIERGQFVLERQPLDLAGLVGRVVEEAQPDMERHSLTYEAGTALLLVDGDPLRLEQVVQNLLSNAVKYSPAGGTIRVGVERRERWAVITVADQGVGIPADAVPLLFQRFYRAANVAAHHISGMGIGLYVVREIVTHHGGSVEVISSEGEGSTFTVSLPLLAEATAGGA